MAVIHISGAEAARDLSSVLDKVRSGEEIRIESGPSILAIVPARHRKTLSGAIRWAEQQNLQIVLDDKFGDDLGQVICNREHEGVRNPWEDQSLTRASLSALSETK